MTIQMQMRKNLKDKKNLLLAVSSDSSGGLGSPDKNVQWLKDNVDILMSNQYLQQQQIKEIFQLTNLTRIEAFQNRKFETIGLKTNPIKP